ncbi:D-serine deaminase-like pyridoxal phosphate-dependent protein [Antricoccus suffuscus]|uniref:D-serine deaminase-like pyridoxal phosphate-dependent protein n=1 Tax=Antricoccus suffuscus TaxID=1629062 RepID=A0A2T0ZWP2_9ACTN|nr:alanine racemase [Antricoccus suffuscus]PRZ40772.1 D-serine deaminase-like pyridoxal phosphate-dependent protein [Antricoccus suffuscus]
MTPQRTDQLQTPALIVDNDLLQQNLDTMATALPGARLRPHVKAHKCTALARRQYDVGHHGFTCATIREVEGMAKAGLGEDLLLANEVLDMSRLGVLVTEGHRITVAVDSAQTVKAAHDAGLREVVVDVNVGLPRCGCAPEDAGTLADLARSNGLHVRGVMGYEGHLMMAEPIAEKRHRTEESMELLLRAHEDVGGELVTAGGTGTYAVNTWANEIQAGSYALMDTAYGSLDIPFAQALSVLGTVISVSPKWAVADVGLKALGMDHGNPSIPGARVLFCSDEHITFAPEEPVSVGDLVHVLPAHVDPTVALHEALYLVHGDEILERWTVDLRGW